MKFTKMQGCGNDYVYVNGVTEQIPAQDKPDIVRKLSDRHFGIGGDGVIFIHPGREADFEMEMYNADGSRAEMCGNGIRCVAKYVYDKGLTDKTDITIVSAGQIKYLELMIEINEKSNEDLTTKGKVTGVRVNMGSPILVRELIPVKVEGDLSQVVNEPITVDGKEYRMTCVSMGNPHAVIFTKNVAKLPLEQLGPKFENHPCFPKRVNTEFVEILDRKTVFMRVWERGTGETLACGTGACAVAVAGVLNGLTDEKITVKLLGGELQIEWDREKNLVFMTGPAVTVFEGSVEI
ncbi:MAG: diaminopimelate epimerase [Bacteroidales bacterium]|nr:diaminopimelate epimerase [Lachnoclostridium sp.]MCM1383778.1 diaminopimelate epimerase [Lachnoclostridium sp.]MCM1464406.1 diaminopimelate epimerase [Bacteroidales bacterium]